MKKDGNLPTEKRDGTARRSGTDVFMEKTASEEIATPCICDSESFL